MWTRPNKQNACGQEDSFIFLIYQLSRCLDYLGFYWPDTIGGPALICGQQYAGVFSEYSTGQNKDIAEHLCICTYLGITTHTRE
jgi:hypothetical protein